MFSSFRLGLPVPSWFLCKLLTFISPLRSQSQAISLRRFVFAFSTHRLAFQTMPAKRMTKSRPKTGPASQTGTLAAAALPGAGVPPHPAIPSTGAAEPPPQPFSHLYQTANTDSEEGEDIALASVHTIYSGPTAPGVPKAPSAKKATSILQSPLPHRAPGTARVRMSRGCHRFHALRLCRRRGSLEAEARATGPSHSTPPPRPSQSTRSQ